MPSTQCAFFTTNACKRIQLRSQRRLFEHSRFVSFGARWDSYSTDRKAENSPGVTFSKSLNVKPALKIADRRFHSLFVPEYPLCKSTGCGGIVPVFAHTRMTE